MSTYSSFVATGLADRFAQMVPSALTLDRFIWYHDYERPCVDSGLMCRGFCGIVELPQQDAWRAHTGQHLELHVTIGLRPEEDDEEAALVQHPVHPDSTFQPQQALDFVPDEQECQTFQFNARAAHFMPDQPNIFDEDEFVQDLHHVWQHSAVSWEGEPMSCRIAVWFVDHAWHWPHGNYYRTAQLYEDFSQWKMILLRTWQDHLILGAPYEITLVSPRPAVHEEVAIHIIIVQRPHEAWSTSLVTAIDAVAPNTCTRQMAVTTHERVLVDDLLLVLGLRELCIGPRATLQCFAWFGNVALMPGMPHLLRSGTGIMLQTRNHPIDTGDTGPVLLQLETLLHHRSPTGERLTADSVAHDQRPPVAGKTAVRLRTSTSTLHVPDYLEVECDHGEDQVADALRSFGIVCLVFRFGGHDDYLCVPAEGLQHPGVHCMYCTREGLDSDAAFLHTWPSGSASLTNLDHMRHLHALGFLKTTILETRPLCPGLQQVVFVNLKPSLEAPVAKLRTPSAWPDKQPSHHARSKPFNPDQWHPSCHTCCLDFGIDFAHMQRCFAVDSFPLSNQLAGLDLPATSAQFLSSLPCIGLEDLWQYDRLVIFADGSSQSQLRHINPHQLEEQGQGDTWSFIVICERYGEAGVSSYGIVGWQAQPVIYDELHSMHIGTTHAGADAAEREALFWAMLWRISINDCIPTTFCTDSQTTRAQAAGDVGAADLSESFRLLRGLAQALAAILPQDLLQLTHVMGHSNDPLNDFVDYAAKAERSKSFYLPRPLFEVRRLKPFIPFMWMLFDKTAGLPPLCTNGFHASPPALPCPSAAESPDQLFAVQDSAPQVSYLLCPSFASANVQSLYTGDGGHAGKLHYLRAQFQAQGLVFLGLQETRSEPACSHVDHVLRIASGADRGQQGVELWLNMKCPIAFVQRKPVYLSKKDLTIVHSGARLLFARVHHQVFRALVIVAHCPQSGWAHGVRQDWWTSFSDLVGEHHQHAAESLYVLFDANAASGAQDMPYVGPLDDKVTANTPFLKDFLRQHDLCLPSTFPVHRGDRTTWHSPDGLHECRIDYVAIPSGQLSSCTHSDVLQDFDLGTAHLDHVAVGVQLQWNEWCARPQRRAGPPHGGLRYDRTALKPQGLTAALCTLEVPPWTCDIETQVEQYNRDVLRVLHSQHPPAPAGWKKPFYDEELWTLRQTKLASGHALRATRRRLRLELLFKCWRSWRGTLDQECCIGADRYVSSLRTTMVRLAAQRHHSAGFLREKLRLKKHRFLAEQIQQLPPDTPASILLRTVNKIMGPTNPKKIKKGTIPSVRQDDGTVCATPQEFQQHSFQLSLQDLPSLCDLERSFARVAAGKAIGHDQVPPEICKYNPAALARLSYTQLIKLALHGQEALVHKGGRLVHAHKGRGPFDECASYRSLLISSHQGKVLHRSLRQHQAHMYESYLQGQQLGGRRGVPVTLGVHHLRAFLRIHARRQQSCGVLFLDLKEAFYRVLRPLTLDCPWTDVEIGSLAQRLCLSPDVMQELFAHLRAPCALQRAGLPVHVRNYVSALHTDTWFYVEGQSDRCRTSVGSRPGDSFADTIFGFLWAKVLHQVEAELVSRNILEHYPEQAGSTLFHRDLPEGPQRAYLGPCWMDDLAICITGPSSDALVQRASEMTSYLLETCLSHAMTPNVSVGKTELLFQFRGRRSRFWRKSFFGPQSGQVLHALGEHQCHCVRVTGRYKHLGGLVHHSGDQRHEARQRVAVAHQTFTKQRKVLFCNRHLAHDKRRQIFDSVVLTGMCYGSESWVFNDQRSKDYFHGSIIKLYKRFLGLRQDLHERDDDILVKGCFLSPTEVLRRSRLRYLGTLYRGASPQDWGLINQDEEWAQQLRDDCVWLWQQLHHASCLRDPREHFASWDYLIHYHPNYWKRLINRGCEHAVQQRRNRWLVHDLHSRFFASLQRSGCLAVEAPTYEKPFEETQYYGCMACGVRCASRGGEGAHFFRRHGVRTSVRSLFDGTQCPHCLREYHTGGKLQAHLQRSAPCRDSLRARRHRCPPAAGIGSLEHQNQVRVHDGLLPPLPAQGPRLPDCAPVAEEHEDDDLLERLVEAASLSADPSSLQSQFEHEIRAQPLSWTRCQHTLRYFKDECHSDLAEAVGVDEHVMQIVIDRLLDPLTWPFLCASGRCSTEPTADLRHYETWCARLCSCEETTSLWTPTSIPGPVGRDRVILHAFAGRRRPGDFQWFIEEQTTGLEGITIHVVSLDIVIDKKYGDLTDRATQEFWLDGIRRGWIHSFLGGPPCNTWSKARAVELSHADAKSGPRPVRSAEELWGLSSLRLRELCQVFVGNELLAFCLLALGELAIQARAGLVEHPAEPEAAEAPSIWRLPLVQVLLGLPGMRRLRLAQGLLGADSTKPTELLALNVPTLPKDLVHWRLVADNPRHVNIGRDSAGHFRTAQLKEYPPAFCGALAQATVSAIQRHPIENVQIAQDFLDRCAAMNQGIFGDHIGPDFVAS
eukprot:s993_g24.t2